MKKKERIYLKEIDSIQEHMNKMINKCNDAIKEYSEDNAEWQKISGCKSPYNLNLKLNSIEKSHEKLKKEVAEWREISGCNSPYNLDLKLNNLNLQLNNNDLELTKSKTQINNLKNEINQLTIINEQLTNVDAKKELNEQLNEQRFDIFNKYCDWVKSNNLFNIYNTYIIFFDVFQNEKTNIIQLIQNNKATSDNNHWYIIDFLVYLINNDIHDPDIKTQELKDKIIQIDTTNTEFDVYDKDNSWYNQQDSNIQNIIRKV